MQPRRQPASSGDGRSLVNPFGPRPSQPPGSSFLQYAIATEPPTGRSYNHQHMPGRFWQTPPTTEPSTSNYATQGRRHGASLDLGEFSDTIDTNSTEASEMSMSSFDANSFHDGMAVGHSGGFHSAVTAATMPSRAPATAVEQTPSRHRKSAKPAAAPSDEVTSQLVDAAYKRLDESPDEINLKARKIDKDQNERCQFPGCPNRARVAQSYGCFCNRHVIVAPCGFPGCREKAMERAAMCVKHMELGKGALQAIVNARSQSVPVCKMEGCFKNDQGRGYCRGHEKMLMFTGRLPAHISKRRLNSAYTMCSYPDCNRHSQRHHLCRTHGNLIIKQARELADRPGATESYDEILGRMQKEIRRCTHENCSKNSQRDRLCTMHFYEKHNLQKDGSAPVETALVSNSALRNEKLGSIQLGTGGSDVRTVERTRCGKPGCGNLSYAAGLCVEHTKEHQIFIQSQGRYCDPFPSGAVLTTNTVNEGKPAFFSVSAKQQNISGSTAMATAITTVTTTCSNPMCERESYGRDYCEACQKLFSPLVVSIGDMSSSSHGYPFSPASAQAEEKIPLCRVKSCGQESVTGGLCATHLRAFEMGSLSVDQVKLESHQRQQESATETKHASPVVGKTRKYYCKVEGCGKQAQKRSLCKRHFREHGGLSSDYVPGNQPTGLTQPTLTCSFPGCSQFPSSGTLLCLTHSNATFCWQPGCENLVERQQFCEFHAFRKQCAFEGCLYIAQPNQSGCVHHAGERRCRHEYCDKFAANSDWCRLHQISCTDSPCALCQLHALSLDGRSAHEGENSSRSQYNANLSASSAARGVSGGGGSPFGRNMRLM